MEAPYTPPYVYSFDEWSEHMHHFLAQETGDMASIVGEFSGMYADPKEAQWKGERFFYGLCRMQEALENHPDVFEELYSPGEVGMISQPVVYVFWQMFGGVPDALLADEPDLEEVRALVSEALHVIEKRTGRK